MPELYIGLISGTSMDAIDAALVELQGDKIRLLQTASQEISPDLRELILSLCTPGENEIDRMGQLDMKLGRLFAASVEMLLCNSGNNAADIRAIGSHGQTIRHRPTEPEPFSLQIANPAAIAYLTGIPTVADFRNSDMIAGGQGAPLVPAFHQAVLRRPGITRVVLNLGGIANITVLPGHESQQVTGFDTGPANALIDNWSTRHFGRTFDANGDLGRRGKPMAQLLANMLDDDYFRLAPPKSTGREHFNAAWLDRHLSRLGLTQELGEQDKLDVLATLTLLTVESVVQQINQYAGEIDELLVCGGGARNGFILEQLGQKLSCPVSTTDQHGMPGDWVEAMAFAWLAKQAIAGQPGNLPSVTGARQPVILGGIYYPPNLTSLNPSAQQALNKQ